MKKITGEMIHEAFLKTCPEETRTWEDLSNDTKDRYSRTAHFLNRELFPPQLTLTKALARLAELGYEECQAGDSFLVAFKAPDGDVHECESKFDVFDLLTEAEEEHATMIILC